MSHSSLRQPKVEQQDFVDFRKRRSYTLEEKLEIIKELESGVKQAQVAESKRIAASTVQNIWSTRDRVLRDYRRVRNHSLRKIPRNPRSCATAGTIHLTSSSSSLSSSFSTSVGVRLGIGNNNIEMGAGEYGAIEKALMQWYTRRKKYGGITGPILKAKAQQISKQFGHYDFQATQTWFIKWLARYGVTLPTKTFTIGNNGIEQQVNGGISIKEIMVTNNGSGNGSGVGNGIVDQGGTMEEDVDLWPVTVTYGNLENDVVEQDGQEEEEDEIVDASAFLVQNHHEQEGYTESNKPIIKEMRNGVEVIYRTRGSKGGRYKSYIWKYFREQEEEVDGGTLRYVECIFCNNRVSPKAGRMEKHLQSCEFCPAEINQTELGFGSDLKQGRLLQNTISSTMDDMKDEDGDVEEDNMDEDIIEEEETGSQSGSNGQDQEASSSGCPPVSTLKKRRTFQWRRIVSYKNIEEAELALGDLSSWSRKHKHRTQQGIKTYYGCKFGRHCPVQMHLLFEARTKRVIMFQTMDEHCHVTKLKKRGLPQEAEKPIRQLYNEGVTKPSHIQQALDEEGGIEVPPRYQIAYFLDKIRREENGSMSASSSPIKVESTETITIPGCGSDLMNNWYDESNNGNGDDSGGIEIISYFGGNDGNNGDTSTGSNQNWPEFPITNSGNSSSSTLETNNLFKSAIKLSPHTHTGEIPKARDEISIYPAATTPHSATGVSTVTVTEVQISNNSTNNSSSQSQNCTFRDETTKDGDIIAPGEQNVKRRVINFIEKNFSNRDFLQIHKELQSLKDAQKFTSLIRLASFTAGFLQTAFLDQQHDVK